MASPVEHVEMIIAPRWFVVPGMKLKGGLLREGRGNQGECHGHQNKQNRQHNLQQKLRWA
ncbi:hypothetical protein DPMN_131019 [Dreissena polymorpha]|uniref:Uncharacterized protein n=1 Tax=Dreissena polymorpha TaxID=45954 RepID=A0A9D4H8R0_DREPO|nr:hypothetical protein DPMN_131019 [Dreissena polymorpha]